MEDAIRLMMARARVNHAGTQPFTLTGTLPATATVGVAYSGTLTLGGTFVAPVTITGLPDWLSATVSDTSVAVTGTPASGDVGTDSFTPVATDSTTPTPQVADGPEQTIVVSAAAAGPVLRQMAGGYVSAEGSGTATALIALPAAPTAGDTLVVMGVASAGGSISISPEPDDWTLAATGTISGSTAILQWWTKVADGSEQNITVTSDEASYYRSALAQEWEGPVTISGQSGVYEAGQTGTSVSIGPSATPPSDTALPSAATIFGGAEFPPSFVHGFTSPWTTAPATATGEVHGLATLGLLETAPGGAVTAVLSLAAATSGYYTIQWWTDSQ